MNPELIEQTVRDYSGKLLKIAYTYTKNTCDAEDIVQEVFLSFITSRQEFASQEHIRAWLIRVTINKSKNHVKSAWIAKRSKMPEPCEELSCLELQKKDGLFKLSRHRKEGGEQRQEPPSEDVPPRGQHSCSGWASTTPKFISPSPGSHILTSDPGPSTT